MNTRSRRIVVCVLAMVAAPAAATPAGGTPKPAAQEVAVLDLATGPWRTFITYRTPDLVGQDGKPAPLLSPGREAKPVPVTATEPPGDNWMAPGYDAAAWERQRGPVGPDQQLRDTIWTECGAAWPALICARGTFTVTDPAAVAGLKVRVRYQGGAVVYLNGKEVKRADLPDGPLTLDTRAARYPQEAYLRPDGMQLTPGDNTEFGFDSRDFADRFAMRLRTIEAAAPAALLQKGANVLAVAVYRAPYDAAAIKAPFSKVNWRGAPGPWAHARLLDARLTAAPGAAIVPNVARPQGFQVWTAPPYHAATRADYADPHEARQPLVISAARNGAFTGQIVVGGTEPIEGLKVTAGDLVTPDGGRIAASDVRVRFPLLIGRDYDPVSDTAPEKVAVGDFRATPQAPVEKAAVQPVWFTVHVPADARPGAYAGTVTVEAKGLAVTPLPLSVTVHNWRLPDPKDFLTHTSIWQSYDSVALRYGVPFWSDRHWELMGKSLALTRPLANKFCEVHLIVEGEDIGNSESLVRWIDKGGGAYDYDFTNFDRYLDLYAKKVGRPSVLLLDVWKWGADKDKDTSGHKVFKTVGENRAKVSRLDRTTGKVEPMAQPLYGTKESLGFWKPVLAEVRKRLERRGWMDAACLGTAQDDAPLPPTVSVFRDIWPDVPWYSSGHVNPSVLSAGDQKTVPVRCREWVWGAGGLWTPGGKPYPQPWTSLPGYISLAFPREGAGAALLRQGSSLIDYRLNAERTLQSGLHGIGRVGADWWAIPGRRTPLCGSGGQYNFSASIMYFFHPGPDGAEPTVRSEMFCEGVQTREAITCLQKAMADKKVTGDLATKCGDLINDRGRSQVSPVGLRHWQRDEARLLALCAEAAQTAGTH